MTIHFFFPQLNGIDINLEHLWFQQDGLPCQTADTMCILRETFGERILSFRGPVN